MAAEKYYELQTETVQAFHDVVGKLAFPTKISFKVIGDAKQKKLIVIKKIADAYMYISGFQVLVTINEPLFQAIKDEKEDDKAIEVLFVEELNNLQINMNSGAIKISKADFISCNSVLEKYTPDEVKRVKDIERLVLEQSAEKEAEQVSVDENTTF
jgi:hypothetical protein